MKVYVWPNMDYMTEDDFNWTDIELEGMSDDFTSIDIPIDIEEHSEEFWFYIDRAANPTSARWAMPGSTRQSFIDRWVDGWFSASYAAPSFKEITDCLDGVINGWHRVIGSTPPEYLTTPGLTSELYRACVKFEANRNPWLTTAAWREPKRERWAI